MSRTQFTCPKCGKRKHHDRLSIKGRSYLRCRGCDYLSPMVENLKHGRISA